MNDDLISRQAAIDAIVNTVSDVGLHDNSETARYGATYRQQEIITILESLPSEEPKRGKWIDSVIPNDNGGLLIQVCDQCSTFFPLAYTGGGHNFCPNCGADMRGEDNEND